MHLILFEWEGRGGGVRVSAIRGWALTNFFCLQDGRLFEVGTYSRLGACSIKYGTYIHPKVSNEAGFRHRQPRLVTYAT